MMNRFKSSSSWNQPGADNASESAASSELWEPMLQPATTDQATKGDCEEDGHSQFVLPTSAIRTGHLFLVPIHYEANYKYPLVVWLHSDGYNENQLHQVMPHISLRNYVSVGVRGTKAADSMGHRFNWSESSAGIQQAHEAVANLVDEASERFSVHQERVVLAGYQSGGSMAMRIAMRDPQRFAGAISLGGYMPSTGRVIPDMNVLRERRLPMLWQWAQDSEAFDSDRLKQDISVAMSVRAEVEVRQYCDDDEMNTLVLSDVNHWIMNRIVAGNPQSADAGRGWETHETSFSGN